MYIADLHIHSRYSRATSKDCTPEHLDLWARRKGIHIVGTGDFTHPAWREELTEKLEPAEDGLYVLKDEYRLREEGVPGEMIPRFVVTGEISSIYKKTERSARYTALSFCWGWRTRKRSPRSWNRSGISILTAARSLGWTAMICWRSCWSSALTQSMCRRISGRPTFLCSARFPDLTQWRSALKISRRTYTPWRPGFLQIRR